MDANLNSWISDTLFSSTTWIIFFMGVVSPILSMLIVRDLSQALETFNIIIPKEDRKKWRKLTRTLFFALCITFLFFHFYARLFR